MGSSVRPTAAIVLAITVIIASAQLGTTTAQPHIGAPIRSFMQRLIQRLRPSLVVVLVDVLNSTARPVEYFLLGEMQLAGRAAGVPVFSLSFEVPARQLAQLHRTADELRGRMYAAMNTGGRLLFFHPYVQHYFIVQDRMRFILWALPNGHRFIQVLVMPNELGLPNAIHKTKELLLRVWPATILIPYHYYRRQPPPAVRGLRTIVDTEMTVMTETDDNPAYAGKFFPQTREYCVLDEHSRVVCHSAFDGAPITMPFADDAHVRMPDVRTIELCELKYWYNQVRPPAVMPKPTTTTTTTSTTSTTTTTTMVPTTLNLEKLATLLDDWHIPTTKSYTADDARRWAASSPELAMLQLLGKQWKRCFDVWIYDTWDLTSNERTRTKYVRPDAECGGVVERKGHPCMSVDMIQYSDGDGMNTAVTSWAKRSYMMVVPNWWHYQRQGDRGGKDAGGVDAFRSY